MKDYEILKKIYESPNSLVYKAIIKLDNQPIILKVLKENYPTASELTRYKQEYEITRSLNVDTIVKAYNLQRYENSLAILLEDFGGQSLKSLLSQSQLNLENFLTIAIKTTESLAAIHKANIIHKDINPSNIVYNPQTQQLKIIDFGISTRLSQEFLTVLPPNQLEGTLAYIAPEQTGRMNRGIDYRSDFYSLGVTFYELLTNKLPFETTDLIELVHCHIAQQPLPVHQLIPDLPNSVSNIINKLLAKTPEERYQSAWGIKADLQTCLDQLKTLGKISDFPIATQDICEKFQIPQKLYGREQEVEQLLTAFEQVSLGKTGMILISGYSGIGKSALVNEIHKPITKKRGKYISGKFDQLQRDIPYSAIYQAFQELIRKLLSEPETTLQTWKNKLLEALGNNGQIIIDVIPEVEKIIGKQPQVEQLGASESQNRFNLFFQRFLSVFCQKEHPLVIFIDDLQWADLPSLNLIEQLIVDPDNQYFLLIGAYRDNEVNSTHPLVCTLEKIKQAKVPVNEITLDPLKINHINQLTAETLNCSTEITKPLAELVAKKTGGNPFFLTQLLDSLYQENFLVFNPEQSPSYWQWNLEEIESVSITDNVVDLMVRKIEKLDKKTQQVIKLASCIGNQFNLEILAIVNNKSQIITAKEIQSALDEGLIIPLDNNYKVPLLWHSEKLSNNSSETFDEYAKYIPYKFLHDRVQQAAYSLIPETEKKQVHLQVGRLLLKNVQDAQNKDDELQNNIFDIVNQLNEGRELITDQLEKGELAKLNLQAGKKAKASTAYETALKYIETGVKFLDFHQWSYQNSLIFEVHLEFLEVLYLTANYQKVQDYSDILLSKNYDTLDKVKIYQIKSLSYMSDLNQQKAIENFVKALALPKIDIDIPQNEEEIKERTDQEYKRFKFILKDKQIQDLVDLPQLTDPYKISAIIISQRMIPLLVSTSSPLASLIILTIINLCIQYGNPPQAAGSYAVYGILFSPSSPEDIELGYQFGQLSLKLQEKYNISSLEPLVIHLYYGHVRYWKEYLRNTEAQEQCIHGFQKGRDMGDYIWAFSCFISYYLINLFGGYSLEIIWEKSGKYVQLINDFQIEYCTNYTHICHQIVSNLINKQKDFVVIGDSLLAEESYLDNWDKSKNIWLLFITYVAKTFLLYFFKQYDRAIDYSIKAQKHNYGGCSKYLPAPQHNFYSSLTFLANYHNSEPTKQKKLLEQVEKNQETLKMWTGNCRENFQHKYDLVEAEKARVLGQTLQAQELYDRAIQGAKKYEFIHEEALAYERAAEFYLALDRQEIGQLYLRNAHHCYIRWGAKAKVKQLEEEYPQYLLGVANKNKSKGISTTISTSGNHGEILDLTTVMKASQAISGEIQLENLLHNLMKITIENAGAQIGFLILYHQGNWVIEAQGKINSDEVTILQSIPIESTDPQTSLPILPTTIINYVIRTQENIALNDAANQGQFINDPYIIATKSKSILCTPLINQSQLSGIVYLENNLTTNTFTSERVELLNILSAQAAISIDNSRLYQTLEQRVEERTKELSQTLEVLKATQAELIFENELLKTGKPTSDFNYKVGGSLPNNSPTYVVRQADRSLYQALKQGEFCYILNARQMGKSSLMVRMIHHLNHEGHHCAAIDLTQIGSENVTVEQWYKGLAVDLLRSFRLMKKFNLIKLKTWWNDRLDISPVQRLSQFIEDILLVELNNENDESIKKVFIFLDEVDTILSLKFPVNDFFALIRSCYNKRMIHPESIYQNLAFAFFGVATPSELMTDMRRTPFNIGQTVELESFKTHEAQPLLYGITEKVSNPQTMLQEILNWTGGQPFLTQKLCQLIRNSEIPIPVNGEAKWIENLVQEKILKNWESQDEPEHLKTIRDRIFHSENRKQMLEIYQQLLEQKEIMRTNIPEEKELCLSGLVIKQNDLLKIHNRIYELIFNHSWTEKNLLELS
ncbi:MAG: AAA family ATPase [Okeania sp. SIO2G4]|uniref:AAA family ATPase n=1 Tax=unclassified Okeania TaxID=2634635 RepID=UPI0013BA6DE2|nr:MULTISPECIES: AAA family ATPase [unclassified Okeania]NEP75022.1 AAA family ATPase [Okeania sp. SIO2G5]NEP96106.1 AAA family ATPase [Okeania sp. SIO2F5]NEQ94427.1 AAA family ATPase [Okeania sp. SIO2G4]